MAEENRPSVVQPVSNGRSCLVEGIIKIVTFIPELIAGAIGTVAQIPDPRPKQK